MKKEYIDYLYEQRANVQIIIDELVEKQKQPRSKCCDKMSDKDENKASLFVRREQIFTINKAIEKYLETHSKPL